MSRYASASLQFARGAHASAVAGSTVYVIGGVGAGDHVLATERATIAADGTLSGFEVASALNLAEARARNTATIVDNHAYLIGGETVQPSDQVEAVLAIEQANLR